MSFNVAKIYSTNSYMIVILIKAIYARVRVSIALVILLSLVIWHIEDVHLQSNTYQSIYTKYKYVVFGVLRLFIDYRKLNIYYD